MIGRVDLDDPADQLVARDAIVPDRADAGDARRNEADAAAGARRLEDARRRQRRRDQGRVDLALVAIEVDLGARRPGDEGGGAGVGGAPDQAIDQPVLERLEHDPWQPRRLEERRAIVASGMGHREDDRRGQPLGSDSDEVRHGWGLAHRVEE